MEKIVAQNEFCTSTFDTENKIMKHKFSGRMNDTLMEEVVSKVEKFVGDESLVLLGNIGDIAGVEGTFTHWNSRLEALFGLYVQRGLKAAAQVLPKDVFGQFSNDQLQESVIEGLGVVMKDFDNMPEAEVWVKEKLGE